MKQQNTTDVSIMPQLDKACGLDMHKDKIVGFISCKDGSGQDLKEFGTFTCELRQICTLLLNGLVRPSFMPAAEQRTLRDHCRSRLFYMRQQNKTQNRLLKILESNNIKLRFNTADHLTAWCGLAPGNNESAGKRRDTSVKKGNPYLKTAIVTAAWAAVRVKDSYWRTLFERLRKRMKVQKAIVAIARRMLKVVHKTLSTLTLYQEKGIAHSVDLQAKAAQYYRLKQQSPSVIYNT